MAPTTTSPVDEIRIGNFGEKHLLRRASEIVTDKTRSSTIFDVQAEAHLPRFQRSELTLGHVLGRGGFCTVHEISQVTLVDSANGLANGDANRGRSATKDDIEEENHEPNAWNNMIQDRKFIAAKCIRKGKDARYALKLLSPETLEDPERFVAGIIDLAIEARFLAVVKHPNIIKMRAMSDNDPYSRGFFLVLDRLYDTLTKRCASWKKQKGKIGGVGKIMDMGGKKKKDLWIERILVAYDLSSALNYLHSHSVVYRDLKPDNIGFDVRGDVKIFDFGLAKEIRPEDKVSDDLYKLTGHTGSLRYMAPEVALEQPYNHTVDIFSFGILLWQMCSLETPFTGYSVQMHSDLVVKKGYRPKVKQAWSLQLSNLMKNCWSSTISDRPEFSEVSDILREEVSLHRGEEQSTLDISNRTAQSMQRG